MARVHHVKHARKDNPVCKKGEDYYHWTPFRSAKRYSKTYPRGSQLCSGRKSEVMAHQEALADDLSAATDYEEIKAACEACAEGLRQCGEEYKESAENMREYFPDSEQADNMEEMAQSLETQADELEGLDFDGPEDFDDPEPEEPQAGEFGTNDEYEDAVVEYDGLKDEWDSAKEDREEEIENFCFLLKEEAQSASDDVEFLF